ncbi:DUF6783 domain-containing protein [Blautia glucerasea]|uniref:DUF6783 domain-containing protein n=1 Tax=Blautia glucerasea TaxID=536633 RepID=UPI00299F55D5|nr:DUF6783 domain-containing protein [Blautia glucerasea]
MCVTICGRFRSDEGAVAGYGNRIRVKYTAKWGVQIAGMIFQTRFKTVQNQTKLNLSIFTVHKASSLMDNCASGAGELAVDF